METISEAAAVVEAAEIAAQISRRGVRVSIVIPAHNEAKNLPYILPFLPDWVHEVILVNDHSTDETVEVARKLLPEIHLVHTQSTRGKGGALQAGFAETSGDIIVMMDGDGSSDPREIPRFVKALLSGAYFAKGSRFIRDGGSEDITRLRRFGAYILTSFANQLFRTHASDMFCGLNAFWKDCLNFFTIDCEGFDVEMLIHLRVCKANLEMVEVPSYEHSRIHGSSNFRTFQDGWYVLRMILREWMNGRAVIRSHRVELPNSRPGVRRDDVQVLKTDLYPGFTSVME